MSRRGVPERIISGHVKNHKDGSMEKGGSLSVGRVGWFGEPKSLFSWQDFTILLFPDIAIMVIEVTVDRWLACTRTLKMIRLSKH